MKSGILIILLIALLWIGAFFALKYPTQFALIENTAQVPLAMTVDKDDRKNLVVLVPGHDPIDFGAEFKGLTEERINLDLSVKIKKYLDTDGRVESVLIRNPETYMYENTFQRYLDEENANIAQFRRHARENMKNGLENGAVTENITVYHNTANDRVADILYGVNHFSNTQDAELSFHVHFNDYPRTNMKSPGKYAGFAIYIPEGQYENHENSLKAARVTSSELSLLIGTSTFPLEEDGIIESQELIAIGSNGTRNDASILVEYGYIYESPLHTKAIREAYLDDLAFASYKSIIEYFDLEPRQLHTFPKLTKSLAIGATDVEVYEMQRMLGEFGVYPPDGKDLIDCPYTGKIGPCTVTALRTLSVEFPEENLPAIRTTIPTPYIDFLNELVFGNEGDTVE